MSEDMKFMQNRELSWLRFNERVLREAEYKTVPLFERLKFISIFVSNLDEFYMIRVGSLSDMSMLTDGVDNKTGLTARDQLYKVYRETLKLYFLKDKIFNSVDKELAKRGINNLDYNDLTTVQKEFADNYFFNSILPSLTPNTITKSHMFPYVPNNQLTIIARLSDGNIGVLPIDNALPDFVVLPGVEYSYILTERLIYEHLADIFPNYIEKNIISITRNADVSLEDDGFEDDDDYRNRMKKVLIKRKRMAAVRLEAMNVMSIELGDYLLKKLVIGVEQVFYSNSPIQMRYVFKLIEEYSRLNPKKGFSYPKHTPQISDKVNPKQSMMKQVAKNDILLSYPYESMESFLKLIKEASISKEVQSIKITIYRLSSKAKLVEYLCSAAKRGKEVVVLMELRARFDEANNINWSEQLEAAGCKVIYGMPGYKVHSKICLITMKSKGGLSYITQVGTGNYNEKTALLYTDVCLITADKAIAVDAVRLFDSLMEGRVDNGYSTLLVAPMELKPRLLCLIDKEIEKGIHGRIIIKANSITDYDIITKLSQASCAGVKVQLIIRGICCILPRVSGKTDNVSVCNVVGRFLEHSRLYCFGSGSDMEIYISSADLMTRNTERRVEIACPIKDTSIKKRLVNMLNITQSDNEKGRVMISSGDYAIKPRGDKGVDSQRIFMEEVKISAKKRKDIKATKAIKPKAREVDLCRQ